MPSIDVVVSVETSATPRVKQLSGMFDVPLSEKLERSWRATLPLEQKPWQVGFIVGPSGCGKSIVARELFGAEKVDKKLAWNAAAIIDDFDPSFRITEITDVCSAVGFNTIPSWMKPFQVLSNGEQFRAELARRLLEEQSPVIVDEFTSVVDRQVAKIASHATQKYVRKNEKRQFVAVSCHHDIIDWLQPDWVFRPDTCEFHWRCLQQRPNLDVEIRRVDRKAWKIFAPFHYMSQTLNHSARCFGLFVKDQIVSFTAVLPRPISHGKNKGKAVMGATRAVTLPDYQGLGLYPVLGDTLAAAYKALGYRYRSYPAHPAFIQTRIKSPRWKLVKRPGVYKTPTKLSKSSTIKGNMGGRPNAVFEYIGEASDRKEADRLIYGKL